MGRNTEKVKEEEEEKKKQPHTYDWSVNLTQQLHNNALT